MVAKSSPQKRGEALGITSSITSLSMAIAPPVSGYLFGLFIGAPFLAGALFMACAFVFLYGQRKTLQATELSENVEIISEI
jgi:MFS family permease